MSNKRKPVRGTNPRRLGGDMVGNRDPHERGGVLLDTRNAVLLDSVDVSTVDAVAGRPKPEANIALLLEGRVNQSADRVRTLYLFDSDGAAAIVTELLALLGRATGVDPTELLYSITARMTKLREDGNLT